VAGDPFSSQRQSTADQLSFLRNIPLPQTLLRYSELRGRLIRFGEESPEQARVAAPELFKIENGYKARYDQLLALNEPGFIEGKLEADLALKAKVDADPKLKAIVGDPWSEIAQAENVNGGISAAYELLESGPATGSDLYGWARTLVRSAAERRKPNSERLPDFTDSRLPLLEKGVTDAKPVDPKLEQLELELWLTKVREYLTKLRQDAFLEIKDGYTDSGAAAGKDTKWKDVVELKPETTTKEEVKARHKKKVLGVVPIGGSKSKADTSSTPAANAPAAPASATPAPTKPATPATSPQQSNLLM